MNKQLADMSMTSTSSVGKRSKSKTTSNINQNKNTTHHNQSINKRHDEDGFDDSRSDA
jgi:hypothetical protein